MQNCAGVETQWDPQNLNLFISKPHAIGINVHFFFIYPTVKNTAQLKTEFTRSFGPIRVCECGKKSVGREKGDGDKMDLFPCAPIALGVEYSRKKV